MNFVLTLVNSGFMSKYGDRDWGLPMVILILGLGHDIILDRASGMRGRRGRSQRPMSFGMYLIYS